MATMATSQGASVFMNFFVENPIDSERQTFSQGSSAMHTGLPDVNTGMQVDLDWNSEVSLETNRDECSNCQSVFTSAKIEHDGQQNVIDQQLSIKLQQLLETNQRTMEEFANLMKASKRRVCASEEMPVLDDGSILTTQLNTEMTKKCTADQIEDMFANPLAKSCGETKNSHANISPTKSCGIPSHSASSRSCTSPAPSEIQEHRRAYSLDDKDWHKAMLPSTDANSNAVNHEAPLDPALIAAVSQIRDMWQGFTIDDSASVKQNHNSNSSAEKKSKKKHDTSRDWRHRTTIPKPFEMSVREASRVQKKTKAQLELDEHLLAKQLEEEKECQKKFKAQPAPTHIYLPLYSEIQLQTETRRHYLKQHSQDLLKSQEKPFSFIEREEAKKQHRVQSATVSDKVKHSAEKARDKDYKFVARPVPAFVANNTPKEMFLEEEELRKIRIGRRAHKMLKKSALPPNMTANQKLKEQHREKEKRKTAKSRRCKKRSSRSTHQVPDYDLLFHNFQKDLANRKYGKEATVMEPFSVEAHELRSTHDCMLQDTERDGKHIIMRERVRDADYGVPQIKLGVLPSYLDSLPFQSTTATHLRTSYLRSTKERQLHRKEQQEEEEQRKRLREGKLRKYVSEHSGDAPRRGYPKGLLKNHKQADHVEQYDKDFEDMRDQYHYQPTENKFKATLKSTIVDDKFLQTGNSAPYSIDSSEEVEEIGVANTTFTKYRY